MSEATPTTPTFIQIPPPNPPNTFDPKGVLEAGNGIVPKDGKGFVPLTDFPPTKPYDDWSGFLDKKDQQLEEERIRLRNDDPVTKLENDKEALKTRNKELDARHEADLNQRINDLEEYLRKRHDDLTRFHGEELRLNEYGKDDLKARVANLEAVRNTLEARIITDNDRHVEELKNQYEIRIAEIKEHNEILRLAQENSWERSKEMTTHVLETVQAREKGIKINDFLTKNLCVWDGKIWGTIFIVSLLFTGVSTGFLLDLKDETKFGIYAGFAVSAFLVSLFCIFRNPYKNK